MSGCVAVVAGGAAAGTVAYIRGELQVTLDSNVRQVTNATEKALSSLDLNVIEQRADGFSGNFVARSAQDQRITILLERAGESMTKVRIRVGAFGDQQISQGILDEIRKNL